MNMDDPTATCSKKPRRMKKEDRIDKIEKSLSDLLEFVKKQHVDTNATKNDENLIESAGKRKLQLSPKTQDLETPKYLQSPKIERKDRSKNNDEHFQSDLLRNEELFENNKKRKIETDSSKKIQTQNMIKQSKVEIIGSYERSPKTNEGKSIEIEAAKIKDLPKFDGKSSDSLQGWINKLEFLAKQYSWDEMTLINNMKKAAEGDVLQWFNRQNEIDIPWQLWKKRLYNKWHSSLGRDQVDKLQEFVCTYRHHDERPIDFFYAKKKLGEFLGLSDSMICNVIIHRLRDPLLEEVVLKRDCIDTRSLFKFLKEFPETNRDSYKLVCDTCGRRGHATSQCYGPCKFCNKTGHRSEFCRYRT